MKLKNIFLALSLSSSLAFSADLTITSFPLASVMFKEYNQMFKKHWFKKTNQEINLELIGETFNITNAKVQRGTLDSNIVSLANSSDIEGLVKAGLVEANWKEKLPNQTQPYYSTVAFLVRKGNPKGIKDWNDLVRPKVSYIFANPANNHNPRFAILSALMYAQEKYKTEAEVENFMREFALHLATVGDKGAKATQKFLTNPSIDALLIYESEVINLKEKHSQEEFEVVIPSISVLAEFSTVMVDKLTQDKTKQNLAEEYLKYLYTEEAQEFIASKYHYRVPNSQVMLKYQDKFPAIKLRNINELGDYPSIEKTFFSKNGKWNKWLDGE